SETRRKCSRIPATNTRRPISAAHSAKHKAEGGSDDGDQVTRVIDLGSHRAVGVVVRMRSVPGSRRRCHGPCGWHPPAWRRRYLPFLAVQEMVCRVSGCPPGYSYRV